MNLPHGEYLLFVKEFICQKNDYVEMYCIFPIKPTLAMFLEAAAQCTVGFNGNENRKMGFLTMGKEIKILNNILTREYIMKVTKSVCTGAYHQFNFEAFDYDTKVKVVSGTLTLQIEGR